MPFSHFSAVGRIVIFSIILSLLSVMFSGCGIPSYSMAPVKNDGTRGCPGAAEYSSRAPMTWSGEKTIDGDHIVGSGEVLVIEPGTIIYFSSGAELLVKGTLLAKGEPGREITFGSVSQGRVWKGIRFEESRFPEENGSLMDRCIIRDAGVAVTCSGGNLILANTTVIDSREYDVILDEGARVRLLDCRMNTSRVRVGDRTSRLFIDWFLNIDLSDQYPVGADIATVVIESYDGTECCRAEANVPGSKEWVRVCEREFGNESGEGTESVKHTSHRVIAFNEAGIVKQHRIYMNATRRLGISFSAGSDTSGMVNEVSIPDLEATIHDLTDFGNRHVISNKKIDAADYLYRRFREFSRENLENVVKGTVPVNARALDVGYGNKTKRNFMLDNGTLIDEVEIINVMATLAGTNVSSDREFVVSAHYDTHALDVPGADDDASGIAGVFEAARIMSQYTFGDTVQFVAFDSEEEDYLGSENYVSEAWQRAANIVGDLQLDMIGYNNDTDYHCVVWCNNDSVWLGDLLKDANERYEIGLNLRVYNDLFHRNSDHRNFWDLGYPAVELIEYEAVRNWNPYYHTANDTIDTINFTETKKITQLTLAGAADMVGASDSAPSGPVVLFPDATHNLTPRITWLPSVDLDRNDVNYRVRMGTAYGDDDVFGESEISETFIEFGPGNLSFGNSFYLEITALDSTARPSPTVYKKIDVVNEPPVLGRIKDMSANEDELLSFNVTAADADAEPADALEYSENSILFDIDPGTGAVRWTPGNDDVGVHRVNFSVHDGNGGADFEVIRIEVVNVNDPPEVTGEVVPIEMDEDTVLAGALDLHELFRDIDGDTLARSYRSEGNITCTIHTSGLLDLTTAKNWFGSENLTLTATDPSNTSANVTVEVTVLPVNDPPVLERIEDITVREGESVLIEPRGSDVDTEILHYVVNLPMTGNVWLTDHDDAGLYEVYVSVFDGEASDSQIVYILVENVNRNPVAVAGTDRTVIAGNGITFDASQSYDPDNAGEGGDGDHGLTYIWDFGGEGTTTGRTVSHRFEKGGMYTVELTAKDGEGGTGFDYVRITVEEKEKEDEEGRSNIPLIIVIALIAIAGIVFRIKWSKMNEKAEKDRLWKLWEEERISMAEAVDGAEKDGVNGVKDDMKDDVVDDGKDDVVDDMKDNVVDDMKEEGGGAGEECGDTLIARPPMAGKRTSRRRHDE